MSEEEQTGYRTPVSDLDLNWLMTETSWGKEATPSLNKKLTKVFKNLLDEGESVDTEYLWELLSYFTRDLRFGNLSVANGEFEYCRYWLEFAGDCLRAGYIKSFLSALTRVINVLELSQSKGGFFRKRSNTITSENYSQQLEPQKRGWFGNKKQNKEFEGGRY